MEELAFLKIKKASKSHSIWKLCSIWKLGIAKYNVGELYTSQYKHIAERAVVIRVHREPQQESCPSVTYFGFVSASVTWRMKMESAGWLMSPCSCM